jgi:hypothetical protein
MLKSTEEVIDMKKRQREPDYLLRRPSGDDYDLYLDDVTDMLKQNEDCQETISDNLAIFQGWLEMFPKFADKWKRFQSAGGVTARDWKKFCEGTMRHRSMREKKHLRLVSSHCNKPIRRIRLNSTGNDAA